MVENELGKHEYIKSIASKEPSGLTDDEVVEAVSLKYNNFSESLGSGRHGQLSRRAELAVLWNRLTGEERGAYHRLTPEEVERINLQNPSTSEFIKSFEGRGMEHRVNNLQELISFAPRYAEIQREKMTKLKGKLGTDSVENSLFKAELKQNERLKDFRAQIYEAARELPKGLKVLETVDEYRQPKFSIQSEELEFGEIHLGQAFDKNGQEKDTVFLNLKNPFFATNKNLKPSEFTVSDPKHIKSAVTAFMKGIATAYTEWTANGEEGITRAAVA